MFSRKTIANDRTSTDRLPVLIQARATLLCERGWLFRVVPQARKLMSG